MYNDYCQTCEALNLSLNSDKTLLDRLAKAVEDAYKKLHTAGKYEPKDVTNYKDLIDATNDIFTKALEKGVADNVIPGAMKMALEKDVFIFSGLKTHAQLFEASRLLLDENKNVKPFSKFSKDIESIKANYNQNYLEAEYIFAQTSSQMAAKWNDITQNGDRYNIQYRTAGDEKVRDSHRVLDQITLPASDAFWNQFYPPNGWRCRCDAVEVLNSKYDKSDSEDAIKRGEKATSLIGKDGKNRLEIFRFNPGKEKVIFPPKHPYLKVIGADVALGAISEIAAKNAIINSRNAVKEWMKSKIPEKVGIKIKTKIEHLESAFLGRSQVKKMLSTGSDFPIEKHDLIIRLPQLIKEAKYIGWAEDEVINGVKKHREVDYWKYFEISFENKKFYICVKKLIDNKDILYSIEDKNGFSKIRGIKKESPIR